MAVTANDGTIALGAIDGATHSALHGLSPVIFGLVAPAIAASLVVPAFATNASALIALLLVLALVVSIAAYAATIFVPADPIGLEIDRQTRLVTVVSANPFSVRRAVLDFADVASLRYATFYDQDGYAETGAELTTHDGDVIEFAGDVSRVDVDAARRALGFRDTASRTI